MFVYWQYASIVFGLSNTMASLSGILSPGFAGLVTPNEVGYCLNVVSDKLCACKMHFFYLWVHNPTQRFHSVVEAACATNDCMQCCADSGGVADCVLCGCGHPLSRHHILCNLRIRWLTALGPEADALWSSRRRKGCWSWRWALVDRRWSVIENRASDSAYKRQLQALHCIAAVDFQWSDILICSLVVLWELLLLLHYWLHSTAAFLHTYIIVIGSVVVHVPISWLSD